MRRFPLEAGLPPGFDVQDDAAGKALQAEALDALSASRTKTLKAKSPRRSPR
ncbi:MAG: hypothetical protein JKP95_02490 [Oceanicaulis sp.]|nr:hypothetical protein [Oceanicaulis sp.]